MIEAALDMGWSYILLVHTDDDYGLEAASTLKLSAKERSICISNTIKVSNDDQPMTYFKNISRIIAEDPASAIIYFGQEDPGRYTLTSHTAVLPCILMFKMIFGFIFINCDMPTIGRPVYQ